MSCMLCAAVHVSGVLKGGVMQAVYLYTISGLAPTQYMTVCQYTVIKLTLQDCLD